MNVHGSIPTNFYLFLKKKRYLAKFVPKTIVCKSLHYANSFSQLIDQESPTQFHFSILSNVCIHYICIKYWLIELCGLILTMCHLQVGCMDSNLSLKAWNPWHWWQKVTAIANSQAETTLSLNLFCCAQTLRGLSEAQSTAKEPPALLSLPIQILTLTVNSPRDTLRNNV